MRQFTGWYIDILSISSVLPTPKLNIVLNSSSRQYYDLEWRYVVALQMMFRISILNNQTYNVDSKCLAQAWNYNLSVTVKKIYYHINPTGFANYVFCQKGLALKDLKYVKIVLNNDIRSKSETGFYTVITLVNLCLKGFLFV